MIGKCSAKGKKNVSVIGDAFRQLPTLHTTKALDRTTHESRPTPHPELASQNDERVYSNRLISGSSSD